MSLNNLSNILLKNLNNHVLQTSLNPNEIDYLQKLVSKRPFIFIKMTTNINKIIYDNIVYLYDIPQIILLLSDIYRSNILTDSIEGVDLINIIDYTINTMINNKLLYFQDDMDIIKLLVDSSMQLLRIKISIIEKEKEKEKEEEEEVKYCCFYF